jgi:hypothetical protein
MNKTYTIKNKNKINSNNNHKIKSYNSFLNLSNNKLDISKDNDINEDLYLNIDTKNYFSPILKKDLSLVQKRIESFNESENKEDGKEEENQKKNLIKEIMKKFLGKLFPECDISARKISNYISNDIRTTKKLTSSVIEEHINYFFGKRYDFKYSTTIKMTKDFFRNCGYLLCYIYSKLNEVNLKKIGGIKTYISDKVIGQKINVIVDFYNYCTENELDMGEMQKVSIWKKLGKKYDVPPELIFLVNIFHTIDTLDFDIEFDGESLNEEDLKLFTITILNISYILPQFEKVNINFINNELQYFLYEKYYKKILNIIVIGDEYIKKNLIKNNFAMYDTKWDFEHDFNLEEYRQKKNEQEKKDNLDKVIYDRYSILYHADTNSNYKQRKPKKSVCNSSIYRDSLVNALYEQSDEFTILSNEEEEEEEDPFSKIRNKRAETIYIKGDKLSAPLNKAKTNEIGKESAVKDRQNFLVYDFILMIICGVTRIETIKRLSLSSNDFYNKDLIIYLKKYFGIDVSSIDAEFHILDLLYNKTKNLDVLNLEINSLDIISFDKILGVIYKNQTLISLKLSFFSSDVSYLITSLFKSYEQIKSYQQIKDYVLSERKTFCLDNFEDKIVNDISLCFVENLNLLFEIIKNKNNLEVLGLNFDLPKILKHNMNYKLPIIKFILNIIFLIDNNESRRRTKIKKLTILSPLSIFDNRQENNINEIFREIRIYKNSRFLKELNIQIQFFKIINIKNLISPILIKLSIGDLDIPTFSSLVNYLTSYEFSTNSVLTNLSIKLQKKITKFDNNIKFILRQLFELKIKTFLELKLFSNILITNKVAYIYLIRILKNNWIPSYVITLNEKSKDICNNYNFLKNQCKFLVSFPLEHIILDEIGNSKNDKKKKKEIYEEVYWILKYILYCRYAYYQLNFLEIKKIVFTILQFLYVTSNIKLSHTIQEPTNPQ